MKPPIATMPFYAFVLLCLFATGLAGQTAAPATLSQAEKDTLTKEAREIVEAGTKGDAEVIIKKTHPIILKFFGTQERFEEVTRSTLKNLVGAIEFHEFGVGEISPIHPHGTGEICFVPTTFVATIGGQRARNLGFMFAIREKGKTEWRFLDSAFMRKDPSLLWKIFPELPKDVALPSNKVEIVE